MNVSEHECCRKVPDCFDTDAADGLLALQLLRNKYPVEGVGPLVCGEGQDQT